MTEPQKTIHATSVAVGKYAALIFGESGSGKSDLALRFINLTPATDKASQQCRLVADDRVIITMLQGRLYASAPEQLAGKIEVRGLGIIQIPHIRQAEICLAVNLVPHDQIPRVQLPLWEGERKNLLGYEVPAIKLEPFENSAPHKLRLAIQLASEKYL